MTTFAQSALPDHVPTDAPGRVLTPVPESSPPGTPPAEGTETSAEDTGSPLLDGLRAAIRADSAARGLPEPADLEEAPPSDAEEAPSDGDPSDPSGPVSHPVWALTDGELRRAPTNVSFDPLPELRGRARSKGRGADAWRSHAPRGYCCTGVYGALTLFRRDAEADGPFAYLVVWGSPRTDHREIVGVPDFGQLPGTLHLLGPLVHGKT